MIEQLTTGKNKQLMKIKKPCAFCGELIYTNYPLKQYHEACYRKRKAILTKGYSK